MDVPTAEPTEEPIDPAVHARRWRILLVLCLSLVVVMVANISLNVALPALARDLDASGSALQWMVDSYALVFAGLLFTAGTIGDRFGRKRALQAGLVVFLLGAVLATAAQTAEMVIVARVVMGMAAAFVMPSTLSILTNVFPARERGRAISTWAGVAAGGASVGPVASGFLLEHFWWGSVFLINVPVIALALVAGRRLVPESRDPEEGALDAPGAALSIVGVGALVYGIIEGPHAGWASGRTFAAFGVAALALALFAWRERTTRRPMLDLALFRDRRFSVGSAGIALAYFAMFGVGFLVPQYLQLVRGHSPLESGLIFLPVPIVVMTVAPQVPRFVERYGPRRVIPVGLGLLALGLVTLSRIEVGSPLALVFLSIVPMAAGVAVTGTPLTTLVMSAVPLGRAGVGSAMNDTSRELGGALGVAVLGSIVSTQFTSSLGSVLAGLPVGAEAAARTGLAGALGAAEGLPGPGGAALADAARAAFVDGLSAAALVAAGLALVAAVAARLLLPRSAGAPAPDAAAPTVAVRDAEGDGVALLREAS